MFPPSSLPLPGEVLLITDELLASADFLLHRFLSSYLKESKHSPALLVSMSEDLERWNAIAGRSTMNFAHLDSRNVTMINAMSHLAPTLENTGNRSMRGLFDAVRQVLVSHADQKVLVILDDLASLEWIGMPHEEISRFARILCVLCRQCNAILVLRHHIVTPGEPDELSRRLLQLCNYHMDVFPLSTGRSGSVSGQRYTWDQPQRNHNILPFREVLQCIIDLQIQEVCSSIVEQDTAFCEIMKRLKLLVSLAINDVL